MDHRFDESYPFVYIGHGWFITVWKEDLVAKFFFGADKPICEIRIFRSQLALTN